MKLASWLAAALCVLLPSFLRADPIPYADYDLRAGTFSDFRGTAPDLVPGGGGFSSTGYAFGPNQGVSLSNTFTGSRTTTYTIAMRFALDETDGFRKLIDFKNLASDQGLYNRSTELNFFSFAAGSPGTIPTGQFTTVALTRDSATNQVVGYVNGLQQLAFVDGSGAGSFTGAGNIGRFLIDDNATSQQEASGGTLRRIQIYDTALSSTEVALLDLEAAPQAVPAPPAFVLGALALGVGFWRRKRGKKGSLEQASHRH